MMDTDFESLMAQKIITVEALLAWQRFKGLHPNTPEIPDYSEASVKRWLYHINEAEKNKGFEKVKLDLSNIEGLREKYRVSQFDDFTKEQQSCYRVIARCFLGVQVYACGSQVRGDYMREHNFSYVVEARQKAGMRVDRISDFDFWVAPNVENKWLAPLPHYADRYRGKFNEKEMIPIPIYYGDV